MGAEAERAIAKESLMAARAEAGILVLMLTLSCTSNDVTPGGVGGGGATGTSATSGIGVTGANATGSGGTGQGFGNTTGATTGSSVSVGDVQVEADNADNCPITEPADGTMCMILNDCAYDATGDLCVCSAQTWTCALQQTDDGGSNNPFGMGPGNGNDTTGNNTTGNNTTGGGGGGGTGGSDTTGDSTADTTAGAGAPGTEEVCPAVQPNTGETCPAALNCSYGEVGCECRFSDDLWFCQ
jgi:hypothetical protein